MSRIICNEFVKRQTPESRFSHFNGTWEELEDVVTRWFRWDAVKPGYKDGVILVTMPPDRFFSGVVEVTSETPLKAVFEARRGGEEPFISVLAVDGKKAPAQAVHVVLYRHDVLGKDATPGTTEEWEIISVNARATIEEEPPTPMAMARNFLELPGGTKADYTAEQFAQAIVYWSRRVMCG